MKETLTKRILVKQIHNKFPDISDSDISKILTIRDNIVRESLENGLLVKLPYCKIELRRRGVNSNISNINFTYKINAEIDKGFRDKLISKELSKSQEGIDSE